MPQISILCLENYLKRELKMFKLDANQTCSFELLQQIYEKIEEINNEKYQFDINTNQIEIISYEQMIDAFSNSGGLPILYPHWSFGEAFLRYYNSYKSGAIGLALEIILNSNPALVYCMEENSAIAQALVLSHAGIGHNYVYKNNFLFKQGTDPGTIIDYLVFARKYVLKCEELYGVNEVEKILDAAHALQFHGIDRYKRPQKLSAEAEEKRREEREQHRQALVNELWNTIPKNSKKKKNKFADDEAFPKEPQENILYFLEKHAPLLKTWQREIIRIVRKLAQYFYPMFQSKLLHEAAASYVHYKFIHDLYDRGHITDGGMLEAYNLHAAVISQPDYKITQQINVYALGFKIFQDIERISMNPTEEDKEWFKGQDWVGNGDWLGNFKWCVKNLKDDTFILQMLSPKIIRDFGLFLVEDDDNVSEEYMTVAAIHNDRGYKKIRSALAKQYSVSHMIPDIQIVDVDILGDRTMFLEHTMFDRIPLHGPSVEKTLNNLVYLWGYPVQLDSLDKESDEIVDEWEIEPDKTVLDIDLSDL